MLKNFKRGYSTGRTRRHEMTRERHMKKATRRNPDSSILTTTCDKYELDALLAGGWDVMNTRTVGVSAVRYDLKLVR
jgi:hypothetical protein